MSTAIATVSAAKRALAEATASGDLASLREVNSMAAALAKGAQARGMGIEAENAAAEVVIRSDRAIGVVLQRMLDEGQRRQSGKQTGRGQGKDVAGLPPTLDEVLAEAGIKATPPTISAWRKLAAVPDDAFESALNARKDGGARLARIDIIRDTAGKPDPAAKAARSDILDAWHSEDAIPEVEKFLAAADRLIAHTDALPEAELKQVGEKVIAIRDWYNAQRGARA